MSSIDEAVLALVAGTPAQDVVRSLGRRYKTLSSLKSAMSAVRHAVRARRQSERDVDLSDFKFSREQNLEYARAAERALIRKNETVVVVDGPAALDSATHILENASPASTYSLVTASPSSSPLPSSSAVAGWYSRAF